MFAWLNDAKQAHAKPEATQVKGNQALQRQERVRVLQARVKTLRATAARQRGNAGVHAQVQQQLAAAEAELARQQGQAASTASREAQRAAAKKLLTF